MKKHLELNQKLPEIADAPTAAANGDFRRLLQETLVSRCKTNPAYSLRAFAKQLQLEPSFLSKLLSGKRKATLTVVMKITQRLSLNPEDVAVYVKATQTSKKKLERATATEANFQNLAIDHFRMIADWYHYAILELTALATFEPNANWISKKLGINKIEAQAALERLERLEMIHTHENGKIENTSGNNTTVGNDFTAVAFRKLQKQILLQALHALENTPIEKRDQSSMTMAIAPELIPEAKKKIKDFRRKLCDFLQENDRPKKQVYQLSVSLFPVTDE